MQAHLIRREVLPFLTGICALVGAALLLDALLHVLDAVWIGRYLGIPGLLLIIASTVYSLRKGQLGCHQGLVVSDAGRLYSLATR